MKKIIIAGSGSGSNFEAIVEHIRKENLSIEILFVFSDNPDAYILERAKRLGVVQKVLDYKHIANKAVYEKRLLELLQAHDFDLLVLAGYMRILPSRIVRRFQGKIINIHPALLPNFPGLHAIEKAYKHGVKVTGVSVHFVDAGVDTGPIIAQEVVRVEEDDTLESLEAKIHQVEHELYIQVIRKLLNI